MGFSLSFLFSIKPFTLPAGFFFCILLIASVMAAVPYGIAKHAPTGNGQRASYPFQPMRLIQKQPPVLKKDKPHGQNHTSRQPDRMVKAEPPRMAGLQGLQDTTERSSYKNQTFHRSECRMPPCSACPDVVTSRGNGVIPKHDAKQQGKRHPPLKSKAETLEANDFDTTHNNKSLRRLFIPELPELAPDNQFALLPFFDAPDDLSIDVERLADGDDFLGMLR